MKRYPGLHIDAVVLLRLDDITRVVFIPR